MTKMPGRSYAGPFQPLSETERETRTHLERHVTMLAGTIGERNTLNPVALRVAAEYLKKTFREYKWEPTAQPFAAGGVTVENIEATIGEASAPSAPFIVVGAHYDSVFGCPGANDNGSGVAALLELARLLPPGKVRLVAFVNEEPPYFQTDQMGSRVYARALRSRNAPVAGMLSLETIGYYSEKPKSQAYPFPLSLFYPSQGNFIGFVGDLASRKFVRRSVALFRQTTAFPSEGAAAPRSITGIDWSDHWAFWQEGYPALMVTDTALFRYPHYHTAEDTPDKLDYERLARVVEGLARVIAALARD